MSKTIYILEGDGYTGKSRFANNLINSDKAFILDNFGLNQQCIDMLRRARDWGYLRKYENFVFITFNSSKVIDFLDRFFGREANIVVMSFDAVKKVDWKIGG